MEFENVFIHRAKNTSHLRALVEKRPKLLQEGDVLRELLVRIEQRIEGIGPTTGDLVQIYQRNVESCKIVLILEG